MRKIYNSKNTFHSKLPFYGDIFPNPVIEILFYQENPRGSDTQILNKNARKLQRKLNHYGIFRVSYLKYLMRLSVIVTLVNSIVSSLAETRS